MLKKETENADHLQGNPLVKHLVALRIEPLFSVFWKDSNLSKWYSPLTVLCRALAHHVIYPWCHCIMEGKPDGYWCIYLVPFRTWSHLILPKNTVMYLSGQAMTHQACFQTPAVWTVGRNQTCSLLEAKAHILPLTPNCVITPIQEERTMHFKDIKPYAYAKISQPPRIRPENHTLQMLGLFFTALYSFVRRTESHCISGQVWL